MKMVERYPDEWKILKDKEKLLVMSNSSFSHSVFKGLVLQARKSKGLFGKGLKAFADNKINVTHHLNWFIGRLKDMLGQGENAGC